MKKIFNYFLLAGIIIVSGAGIMTAQAQANNQGGYPSFVQKIADKFNLDIEEVKAVFDEDRAALQEKTKVDSQTRNEEMLDKFIQKGEITAEQKALILAKQNEVAQKQETFRDMSQEERQEAMENLRDELKAWAEKNGIEENFPFFGRGMGGPGDRGHFGSNPDGFGLNPNFETQD